MSSRSPICAMCSSASSWGRPRPTSSALCCPGLGRPHRPRPPSRADARGAVATLTMQQQPRERGFAAARFADDPQRLALAHRERHAVDRLYRLPAGALDREMLAQIACDQHRLKRAAAVARIEGEIAVRERAHDYIRTSIAARSPSLTRLQQIDVMKI